MIYSYFVIISLVRCSLYSVKLCYVIKLCFLCLIAHLLTILNINIKYKVYRIKFNINYYLSKMKIYNWLSIWKDIWYNIIKMYFKNTNKFSYLTNNLLKIFIFSNRLYYILLISIYVSYDIIHCFDYLSIYSFITQLNEY